MRDAELAARWERLAGVREQAIRAVRARVSRPEDAEDLVHEALLRLAARPALDMDNPGLRSLVVTTASGLAVDGWRRLQRQERVLDRLGAGAVAEARSPEAQVADRSEAAWLAAGLPALGSMERAAILHAANGEPVGEIARLLGVGYKAAENALGRARRKLRLRAAAAALALASLLRRLASRPEAPPVAAIAPVLVAAVIVLGPGASGSTAAPQQAQARVSTVADVLARPPVDAPPVAPAAAATASRPATAPLLRTAPRTAQPRTSGGGNPWVNPDGVPIAPSPEHGDPLVTVGGEPVPYLNQPASAGWAIWSEKACDTNSAACFPVAVP